MFRHAMLTRIVILVTSFFLALAIPTVAQQSIEPRCDVEYWGRRILEGELSEYRSVSDKVPPGKLIMDHTKLRDDRYDPSKNGGDTSWEKWMYVLTHFRGSGLTWRKMVTVQHYMVHRKSRTVEQLKFDNSYEQGCIGVESPPPSGPTVGHQVDLSIVARLSGASAGGGHWEWWDYYSNGEFTGSDDFEYVPSNGAPYVPKLPPPDTTVGN